MNGSIGKPKRVSGDIPLEAKLIGSYWNNMAKINWDFKNGGLWTLESKINR